MRITFEDKNYIEITKSLNPDKVIITIVARDYEKPLATIVSSVELTVKQFNELIKYE
jgi:hypothetical protein